MICTSTLANTSRPSTREPLVGALQPPVTVIIGGRALLMLIAARFSGSGSGKDLLSRAISLIVAGQEPEMIR